jgi:Arc/MetJ family transcription regulator
MTDLATDPTTEPAVDADLLAEAQRQIRATYANEAINEGLRLIVERERAKRQAARARLEQMHDEGLFDPCGTSGMWKSPPLPSGTRR